MRVLRLLAFFLAAGLIAAPAIPAIAAHHAKPPCSVPSGWRVVTQDHQAVIIQQRRAPHSYDYCNRAVGRWRSLIATDSTGSAGTIFPVRLAGRFAAYRVNSDLWVWDTRNGRHNQTPAGALIAGFSDFVLSPDGVAARLVALLNTSLHSSEVDVETLTMGSSNFKPANLTRPESTTGGVQLFDCSAGCLLNTVVVTWTDDTGQTQYEQVTGGDEG
jgi:hypothetical protein